MISKLNEKLNERWIEGGHFLEVSFILESDQQINLFLKEILNNLTKLKFKIQLKDDLNKYIVDFKKIQLDEELDKKIKIPLFINFSEMTKSLLLFNIITEKTVMIDFCFKYHEQNPQLLKHCYELLKSLYTIFNFKLGVIGVEVDCLDAYDCNEAWPTECYNIKNLNIKNLLNNIVTHYFYAIIFDSSMYNPQKLKYPFEIIGKKGIFIDVLKIEEKLERQKNEKQ